MGTSRPTSAKRATSVTRSTTVAAAVVGLGLATTLSGCGFQTRQSAAAVVNGHEISQDALATATQQLNAAKINMPQQSVLMGLIVAPMFRKAITEANGWKPDAIYNQILDSIPNATPESKEIAEVLAILNSGSLTQQQMDDYRAELEKAKITVNPKYGKPELTDNDIYFKLGPDSPNWLASTAAEPAPAP